MREEETLRVKVALSKKRERKSSKEATGRTQEHQDWGVGIGLVEHLSYYLEGQYSMLECLGLGSTPFGPTFLLMYTL